MPWFEDEATATAKGERRALLLMASIFALLTAVHWAMAFIEMRPENPFLCILPKVVLALLWLMLAGMAGYAARWGQFHENQRFLAIAAMATALIGAYVGLRADNDVFTLAVRYQVWRAGGTEAVREAAQAWVAQRRSEQQNPQDNNPFSRYAAGGSSRVPPDQPPKPLQVLRDKFGNDFYASMDDNSLTFQQMGSVIGAMYIYFPGSQPEGEATWWQCVRGSRRQIGDGITVRIFMNNK